MNVEFERLARGMRIHDRIESTTYELGTGVGGFVEADPDDFRVPVTRAVAVETDRLSFPNLADVFVRDRDLGRAVLDVPAGSVDGVDHGTYEIEVAAAPFKLYVAVEDTTVSVDSRGDPMALAFDGVTTARIGVRSRHEHPAGTITVRDDPRDLMRAVSAFGSALKTTSPERSFPTLRGHPPTIERGERFAVPDNVRPPRTDVRIEVPARYDAVYSVATLAYYLGAEVVPGTEARLVAGEAVIPFPYDDVARSANALLRHCFTLDCVVRTEGLYPVQLAERETVLERPDLDLAALYDASLAERTARYLDVPFDVTDGVFEWHLTTDVDPSPDHVGILPYLVNDLSFVRSPAPTVDAAPTNPEPEAVTEFFRNRPGAFVRSASSDVRATDPDADADAGPPDAIVSPVEAETVGHAWVGDDYPMGASKPTVESYQRRLDRPSERDAVIDVRVVCNDPEMREEAENLYGFRDMLEFDVATDFDLTRAETREVLESDTDLLHYIGHVTEDGMQCSDGDLDVREVDEVGIDAFILNGCRSYAQGMELVEAGALGGVVTLDNVYNVVATEVGRSVARLLDNGFDLHGALHVATENVATGYQYTIVGNGGITLCQHHAGCPTLAVVDTDETKDDTLTVSLRDYLTRDFGIGSFSSPLPSEESARYLTSPAEHEFRVSRDRFEELLLSGRSPLRVDGELRWSDELDPSEL